MLSKRAQAIYVESLEKQIADWKEGETLEGDAKLFKEEGIVREQWQPAGAKIEYNKSRLERGGWNIPGPLNLDDEEDENDELDDLGNQATFGEEGQR